MALDVTVGPPVTTINYGNTFLVSEFDGSITNASDQGFYSRDTRYISRYQLYIDGLPWTLLNSAAVTYYASRTYLVNPGVITEHGEIAPAILGLALSRAVAGGLHEDIDIRNYSCQTLHFNLEILIRSDFADIFEVRAKEFTRRGHIETEWESDSQQLITCYSHGDFRRSFIVRMEHCTSKAVYGNGRLNFEVALPPGGDWHACCKYEILEDDFLHVAPMECAHALYRSKTARSLSHWKQVTTQITTSNEDFYRLYRQSVEDMAALRLPSDDEHRHEMLAAAGVPWYVSVFGRDSLIVSLQNLIVYPDFARGTLQRLADLQAAEIDEYRDAEPGKMPHELRSGELAHFRRIPHTPYYGTADATILYLIVLHDAWKWLGDDLLFPHYEVVAQRCLEWIDHYGDRDGDGFQEYQTRSAHGYENMGWKDAGDAVVYPDGSLVKGPKALCELQGYVFDAKLRVAEGAEYFGHTERAAQLRKEAAELQIRFEEQFWCEDLGYYAYALDGDKQPVKTIASNAGHLLWSGIVSPDRAEQVVRRLLKPDLWSGWGIRTLSERNPAYNPFSYQNGSVWPHDNGIIAMGFKRYGFAKEAGMIARDISEAASYFRFHRLPELYAGIRRRSGTFPVQYLGANVPQAWAAGSVFHLIRAILGLDADAHRKTLYIDPVLPDWLPDITLRQLRVGQATVDIRFWREGETTRHDVLAVTGELKVEARENPVAKED
ncbi:amylo-alpha-1,6-glucosidase [Methylobacter sp. YRD-M1]|uniref:amylo-alpha-1,6-glucosidase n=1 Tax=Methylobacter sp. YRD-M1 TaxID=2911520 RepID=UPI00227A0EB7|nr:glycogen debranching N-terminal domain-containing protein [Methylobacter sp. YRD-M1]WAK03342.1 amylo-alpha-1,6-glucosidase [Methylobacter sp. YRD-M1]